MSLCALLLLVLASVYPSLLVLLCILPKFCVIAWGGETIHFWLHYFMEGSVSYMPLDWESYIYVQAGTLCGKHSVPLHKQQFDKNYSNFVGARGRLSP